DPSEGLIEPPAESLRGWRPGHVQGLADCSTQLPRGRARSEIDDRVAEDPADRVFLVGGPTDHEHARGLEVHVAHHGWHDPASIHHGRGQLQPRTFRAVSRPARRGDIAWTYRRRLGTRRTVSEKTSNGTTSP